MTIKYKSPSDRLAVLFVGMGSVATTVIAGVEAIKRGWARPIGSLSQMGWIEEDGKPSSKIKNVLPLVPLNRLVFGGWDIVPTNAFGAARQADVLSAEHLNKLKIPLSKILPMKGIYDKRYLSAIKGTHIKTTSNKKRLMVEVQSDIRRFMGRNKCRRAVLVIGSSTEIYKKKSFDSPTQIYTEAALAMGIPVVNATPNNWGALSDLDDAARATKTPFAGLDLKSGQTLVKTILAPGFRRRMLGIRGWFSTNILGNRDGLVLNTPGSLEAKRRSKEESLRSLLSKDLYPELYGDFTHLVDINYYPPKGDNKEGWDSIDLFGWLDYPMQLKINFLCRDSILAAPLVLDLVLFLDLAKRKGQFGAQSWLNFYFKTPLMKGAREPEHDLSIQYEHLQNQLRQWSLSSEK